MEQAEIRYTVFNYDRRRRRVDVNLKLGKEFCSKTFSENTFGPLDVLEVPGEGSKSSSFTLVPIEESSPEGALIEMQVDFDHVARTLLIEPRGVQRDHSQTWLVQHGDMKMIKFEIPDKGVTHGSRKCWIYAFGSAMGPVPVVEMAEGTLQNVNNLINLPGGCGEQNMIRFAPSVYVHQYRLAAGLVEVGGPEEMKIKANIIKGYQIQLGHRSARVQKQAFAVWQNHPPSTWLSAFTIKVFSEAYDIERIDIDPICTALAWLINNRQAADGHFSEQQHVYHREMDGLIEGDVSVTAYVIVAVAEASNICENVDKSTILSVMAKASSYLTSKLNADQLGVYSLAMTAYAALKVFPADPLASNSYEKLIQKKIVEDNMVYWKGTTRGMAGVIETTAYALLAVIENAKAEGFSEDKMILTKQIAAWLISQRNDRGGFRSTQDTVVGLQAMAEYMTWITSVELGPLETDLTISIKSDKSGLPWYNAHTFKVSGKTPFVRQSVKVPDRLITEDHPLTATINGVGDGTLSYRCIWREKIHGSRCDFNIAVVTEEEDREGNIFLKIQVTVSKKVDPPAQMSIVEVGLISGFEPDKDSLDQLLADEVVDGPTDRYEITKQSVIFYLNKVSTHPFLLFFKLKQTSPVSNTQPSSVSVYDFYEPEISCTAFYSQEGKYDDINTICNPNKVKNAPPVCRCAEGGCIKCRTYEDMTTKTWCINHKFGRCVTCQQPDNCEELNTKACNSHFLYHVFVEELLGASGGLTSFRAKVVKTHKTGKDQDVQGEDRIFRIRTDCMEKCKDAVLVEEEYIKVGRHMYIAGNTPEMYEENGVTKYEYILNGREGFIQRMIEDSTCPNLKKKYEKCVKRINLGKTCDNRERKQFKNAICDQQTALRIKMAQGCD